MGGYHLGGVWSLNYVYKLIMPHDCSLFQLQMSGTGAFLVLWKSSKNSEVLHRGHPPPHQTITAGCSGAPSWVLGRCARGRSCGPLSGEWTPRRSLHVHGGMALSVKFVWIFPTICTLHFATSVFFSNIFQQIFLKSKVSFVFYCHHWPWKAAPLAPVQRASGLLARRRSLEGSSGRMPPSSGSAVGRATRRKWVARCPRSYFFGLGCEMILVHFCKRPKCVSMFVKTLAANRKMFPTNFNWFFILFSLIAFWNKKRRSKNKHTKDNIDRQRSAEEKDQGGSWWMLGFCFANRRLQCPYHGWTFNGRGEVGSHWSQICRGATVFFSKSFHVSVNLRSWVFFSPAVLWHWS